MLQLQIIRQNPGWVKERLAVKNFKNTQIVDTIIDIENIKRPFKPRIDKFKEEIKNITNEIESYLRQKDTKAIADTNEKITSQKNKVYELKEKINSQEKLYQEWERKVTDLLLLLPNLPSEKVPIIVKSETGELKAIGYPPTIKITSLGNVVEREGGNKPNLPKEALPHWELAKKYDLINFELGNKITGSGFPVYKNKGAKLERALIQYFLDYNTTAGYTEYLPPLMVNETTAFGTGQLPDKEGQMYFAKEDNFYLIPTAEVPLTNIYRDEILKEADLPIKMTAYTPCFRREAGSYGKDVRGLNRVHQFDKVEIVQLVDPEKSYDVVEEMVNHVEKLVQSLNLPYRILKLCGGDMSFASALTYDFEVYSAAQDKWLEVSSVSNFETFQTNRMKIRFKDKTGKSQLVHSLNGSSLALPRILACLLENNQTGSEIILPLVLHSYFGSDRIN